MKKLLPVLCVLIPMLSLAQDDEKKFGITFNGFIKNDVFYDSRQTEDFRLGHFLLYPAAEKLDVNGDDINANSKLNILAIQTRLTGKITGPDALGAKTSGLIEGAFFGKIESDINGFRLRHAFVKLNWPNTELLVGQYWHPMFVTSCFPGTVSFNTGAPFQPFSRNPQIRLSQKFSNFKVILSAMEQVDFVDSGPNPDDFSQISASPKFLINSAIPEFNARIEYNLKKDNNEFLLGVGGNYKILTPRLNSSQVDSIFSAQDVIYKTDESVSGISTMAYLKYKNKSITVKLEGVMGQLMQSMIMLGGYAVKEIDPVNGKQEYTPVNTMSAWGEVHTNGPKMQFGIFGGYTKNSGTDADIAGMFYSRGFNIDYVYRIAPRMIYNSGNLRIAPEIEYTVAAYGSTQIDGTVNESTEVANFRFLLGIYYFF